VTPMVRHARGRLLGAAVLLALAGCMGIDVGSVRRAGVQSAPAPDAAIAIGRILFVVDGKPLAYGLLNKPALQLFHRGRGKLMATPETDSDGRFVWELPAGDYGVAVIHGGMVPAQQPHLLPSGAVVFVNGIVDPGVEFELKAGGAFYLGTLVVEVASMPPRDVLFGKERVFGSLRGIRIDNDFEAEAPQVADGAAAPPPRLQPAPMRVTAGGRR